MKVIKGLIFFRVFLAALVLGAPAAFSMQLDTRPITPIPPNPTPTTAEQKKIELGRKLFNDKQLSGANNRSCASCHSLKTGGTSFTPPGALRIPPIFNTQYNFKQFWDARSNTLEAAIKTHLLAPDIMSFNPKDSSQNIKLDDIVSALTAYVKTLNTPNSRFDQYLLGNKQALTETEKKGYALFQSYGCISCHQGRLIGGNILQKYGIYNDYFKTKTQLKNFDLGYYNVTKNLNDRFAFKVPSLRNVALTGPYLHDSSLNNLESVVESMAFYQLGRPILKDDVTLIVQFLHTLTGEIPKQ